MNTTYIRKKVMEKRTKIIEKLYIIESQKNMLRGCNFYSTNRLKKCSKINDKNVLKVKKGKNDQI